MQPKNNIRLDICCIYYAPKFLRSKYYDLEVYIFKKK